MSRIMESVLQEYQRTPAVSYYYFGKRRLPKQVRIYRATTKNRIAYNDWVSTDRSHAMRHMRSSKYRILTKVVSPADLVVTGASGGKGFTEFLYRPKRRTR